MRQRKISLLVGKISNFIALKDDEIYKMKILNMDA
jgi:hypothetical protein